MKRLPSRWTPHTVIVEAYVGEGGNGPIYGSPETFSPETGTGVFCKDQMELVRDESGAEVVSKTRIHFSFEDAPPVGSLVTTWPGKPFSRKSEVIAVSRVEHPNWPGVGVVWLR